MPEAIQTEESMAREIAALRAQVAELQQAKDEATRAKNALTEAQAQRDIERTTLRAVLDVLPVGVLIADRNGKLTETNAAARAIWGETPMLDSTAEYGTYRGWLAETHQPIAANEWALARVLDEGEACYQEVFIETFDGQRKTILNSAAPIRDEAGTVIGGVVAEVDISERKRMEGALRQSEQRYRLLAEAAPQLVWTTNPDGSSEYFNRRWYDYTGQSVAQSLTTGTTDAMHPDDYARTLPDWQNALATSQDYSAEYRLRRADGVYRWFLGRGVPITNDQGQVVAWYGTSTEIDDQKRGEIAQAFVAEATGRLAATRDNLSALAGVTRLLVPQFAQWCSIDMYDEGDLTLRFASHADPKKDDGIQALQQVLADTDIHDDPAQLTVNGTIPPALVADAALGSAYLRGLEGVTVMRVPLLLNDALIGNLTFVADGLGEPFGPAEQKAAADIARNISVAVDNARLTRAMEKALHRRDEALVEANSQRAYFYDLLMDAPAIIYILRGPHHVLEFVNTAGGMLFGNRPMLGQPVVNAVPEAEGQVFIPLLDQVLAAGEPFVGTELLAQIDRHANGTLEDVYVNFVYQPIRASDGTVEGVFVHAVEVTEQVRVRQRVEALAAQLKAVIEALPAGLFVCDTALHMTQVNARGREFFGLTAAQRFDTLHDLSGLVEATLPDGSPVGGDNHPLFLALRGESGTDYRMTIHRTASNDNVQLQISYAPIRADDGAITGAVAIATDMTLLHQLEQQKDAFLSMAAHELKTPITSIKGLVQMAQRRLARAGQEREVVMLGNVDRQVNRLTALVNELTDVSRIQSGRFEVQPLDFDYAALVRRIAEALQSTTTDHAFSVSAPHRLMVWGDPDRLEQVVTNLLGNAIKYSPDGGPVTLTLTQEADAALLSVHDEGIGVPPEDRPHLFERFHRASNAKEYRVGGAGLGLYISSEIVRAHGGRIWLADTQPGSTFYVSLPISGVQHDA